MKTKKKEIIAICIGILLLVLIIGSVIFICNFDKVVAKKEQAYMPFQSSIEIALEPLGETHDIPANSTLSFGMKVNSRYQLSSVEVFINDVGFRHYEGDVFYGSNEFFDVWSWKPGEQGLFYIMVYAYDIQGGSGFSKQVLVSASKPYEFVAVVEPQPGDSLASISAGKGVPIEKLAELNPGVSTNEALGEDQKVFIPAPVIPSNNAEIIPPKEAPEEKNTGLPGIEELAGSLNPNWSSYLDLLEEHKLIPPQNAQGDTAPPEEIPGPDSEPNESNKPWRFKISKFMNNVAQNIDHFADALSKMGKKAPVKPPTQPYIWGSAETCSAKIEIRNYHDYRNGSNEDYNPPEDGFRLYRTTGDEEFELVKILPPHHTDSMNTLVVYDEDLARETYTYVMSAYNQVGAQHSDPVIVTISDPSCKASTTQPIHATDVVLSSDGDLKLAPGIDLAYFYIQMDTGNGIYGAARREPENNQFFMPNSGKAFNIYNYLYSLLPAINPSDVRIKMEIWAWIGDTAVHLKTISFEIHHTFILICGLPGAGSCSSKDSGWYRSASTNYRGDPKTLEYEVKIFPSRLSKIKSAKIQVALAPFNPALDHALGLLYDEDESFMFTKNEPYIFMVSLKDLLYDNPIYGRRLEYADKEHISEFTLYIRMKVHYQGDMPRARYTNQAIIESRTYDKVMDDLPPVKTFLENIYDIHILPETYQPPNFLVAGTLEDPCYIILDDPSGTYYKGQKICYHEYEKAKRQNCDGFVKTFNCVAQEFGKALLEAFDFAGWVYNEAKDQAVKAIAYIIPGCGDTCKSYIRVGIDLVVTYFTGLPPRMPSSEELIAEGATEIFMNLAVAAESAFVGTNFFETYCKNDEACRAKIKGFIKDELLKVRALMNQEACLDEEGNKVWKAMCFPPEVSITPAQGYANSPGSIAVRIYRKTTQASLETNMMDARVQYRIGLTVKDGGKQSWYDYDENQRVTFIPLLEWFPEIAPGNSLTQFLTLTPCRGKDYGKCPSDTHLFESQFDAKYLGSTSVITVQAMCLNVAGAHKDRYVPCDPNAQSVLTVHNPKTFWE